MAQPRAVGEAFVSIGAGQRLRRLRQSGSLKVLFPRTDATMQAILVNTAGGITGGDQFRTQAVVESGAALTLSTQAAERAYRAQPGSAGRVSTRISISDGGRVNWLPQETILFQGCALRRRLEVELGTEARATLVEPVIFGRAAMGEALTRCDFQDMIAIRRQGTLAFLDRTQLTGDVAAQLALPAVAKGAGAMALVLHAAPNVAACLEPVRALLPATAGASLLSEDLLIVRVLAADGFALRQTLIPLLTQLTQEDLSRPWML